MNRHEAYIEKNWEEQGLAHLIVTRAHGDGLVDFAMFLVDLFCLGVKDAVFEADMSEDEAREWIEERLPEDHCERIHPSCAKKLIEGALTYAQTLGFAPHRDFRKARKVLAGIDASACPREFTYGRDGRPCYVRGFDDTDERVNRVCAILAARCGADGFDYEDPGEEEEDDALAVREDLMAWLDDEPPEVPRFYEVSGLITAMLICPTPLSPLKVLDVLWGPEGRIWEDELDLGEFNGMLLVYWNRVSDLVQNASAPTAQPEDQILDIWEEDFADDEAGGTHMTAATFAWATGFRRVTTLWPEAWCDALTRPDLASHWEVVGWWAGFLQKDNRDRMVAAAEAEAPRTLNQSVVALARALRPPPVTQN
jgi:yecA family protein